MDKEKFCFISDLIKSQKEFLLEKDDILSELYDLCDDEEQRNLVKQLLINFSLMDEDVYNLCLKDMSNNKRLCFLGRLFGNTVFLLGNIYRRSEKITA